MNQKARKNVDSTKRKRLLVGRGQGKERGDDLIVNERTQTNVCTARRRTLAAGRGRDEVVGRAEMERKKKRRRRGEGPTVRLRKAIVRVVLWVNWATSRDP